MAYMKTCCYCFKNTKDGSLACAVFYMVICMINTALYMYALNNKEALHYTTDMFNMEKHSVRKMYMCYLAETIIVFLCSVALAVGVKQDNRHLFLPWICCVFLECFGLVAIMIFIIYSIIVRGVSDYSSLFSKINY
ncbi:uncharacterized protein [Centruroides vittatus]|uniref:uncharacterized protein n=1 Tax=Centruroides vittatus TaxID=120091 RepID=UPI00350F461D